MSSEEYDQLPTSETEVSTEAKPVKPRCLDDFQNLGRYAFMILFMSEFSLLCGAGNMMYMIYAGAGPKKVKCIGEDFVIENVCKLKSDYRQLNCTLQMDYEFESLNVEFQYVCNDRSYVKHSISIQMAGVLFGTILFGSLSDRYGRKKILFNTMIATTLFMIASAFSQSLLQLTILRTITGFFNGGVIATYVVYKMEHIPKRHRFWVATVVAWAPNFILINGIAYFAHDWRTFQLAIVGCSLPFFPLAFFTYESPRYLLQSGQIQEARRVLQRIQHIDRVHESKKDEMEKMLDAEYQAYLAKQGKRKNYNVTHLFYNKEMTVATIVMALGKFATSMINYGLVFNMEDLAGSLFFNSFYLGLIRWGTNIVASIVDYTCHGFGRKLNHTLSQSFIAICLGIIAAAYILGFKDKSGDPDNKEIYEEVVRICAILAMATTSQIFIVKSIVTMEFYPTVVRNQAIAFMSVCSRVGTILSPQLFILSPFETLPYVVLTTFSALDTVGFQLALPETKGHALPEKLPPKNGKAQETKQPLVIKTP